jgi:serine/threonine protein kinase
LRTVDDCSNIVRYYQTYCTRDFHYLVLELCDMSLW